MQVQQKLFNKIVFTLRQRKLRFPPPAFRRASGPLRFLFLSAANPLALGFASVQKTKPLLPPTKMFSTMLFLKCDLAIAPSVALLLHLFSLFSFQGAMPVLRPVVENSGIEPLTS